MPRLEIEEGTRVRHAQYGDGTVMRRDKSTHAKHTYVFFPLGGKDKKTRQPGPTSRRVPTTELTIL